MLNPEGTKHNEALNVETSRRPETNKQNTQETNQLMKLRCGGNQAGGRQRQDVKPNMTHEEGNFQNKTKTKIQDHDYSIHS